MMNTLHKSLTIAYLAVSLLISGVSADLARAQSSGTEPMVTLTAEEQAWLKENPRIRLATLTNQPPFSMMDAARNHTGILADILALLSDAIGQQIETELLESVVSDTHEVAKEEGIYGSASILKTSRHGKEYLLTEPVITTPYYIYTTKKNRHEIRRPADLSGKRVAVPRNHRAVEDYLTGIGGVQMILIDTPLEQMQKVVSGEADALIGYFTYPYLVNKYLMVDLVIAFIAKSDQGIHIGVNPAHPVLHGILNKAIVTLDDNTINAITAKWTEVSQEETPRLKLTSEEQAWLAEHPEIVLGAPTDYPPMVIKRADGTHIGVLVDLFAQISRRLKTKVRLHIEDSWADIQQKAQNKEIDGLAFAGRDPSRDAVYNATDTVLPTYFSVFASFQNDYRLKRFSDLTGMRIGYKRAARPTRSLLEKLPSAVLKPYDSHESLTQALLDKEIDVIVAWMSFDHWRKEKLQGTINKVLLIDEYPIEMVTYIRNDWPQLIPILNKTLTVLQQEELPRIINKWFGEWPRKSKVGLLILTPEEIAWLAEKHTVRVRIADWPPYQIVKDNEPPQGIVIEYLELIEKRTGITFLKEATAQPFAEFLQSIKQGQGPDMTAIIAPAPEREAYLSFSEPYISSPYVIIIRGQDKPILDISGLTGKTLAVPRGFVVQEQVAKDYPEIRLAMFDSDEAALYAVATGQADAYIGNLTVASHIIHTKGFSDLQVTAAGPYRDESLSMGIRKDWPELTSIINKALASITEEEKTAIRNRYLAIKFEQGINKAEVLKWAFIIGGAAAGIMLLFVFWNARLSKEISKRKQTEKDLKQARDNAEAANQAKSSFLASMSHELRTPLNAILGFSGMLAREQKATADQQDKLAIINRSGQHLLSMINDVLDLSKIEAERLELKENLFDLVAMIEEIKVMIQSRATKKGISVEVESQAVSFSYLKADMGKLRQILINLLSNAVKFTDKGRVIIRYATEAISKEPKHCNIVIEVEDTGPGIDPARHAKIFEPFMQGIDVPARKGTGLGLSICKKYAEFMGGAIELESEIGKGSLFRLRLPAEIAEAADARTSVEDKPRVIGLAPAQKTWRILAADDSRENLLLLKSLLESVGFVVLEAKNGQEALAAFKDESPDLVWMDMRMPVMDGYEATRHIRQCSGGGTVPIIAITASAFGEQRPDILAAGCDDMVIKPFRAQEIFEAMGRHLNIEYIYEPISEAAPARVRAVELTAAMLADLPGELLQELRQATLALNREDALEVIARIADHAPEVATGLKGLLDNYQMVELRDLLGEVKEKNGVLE